MPAMIVLSFKAYPVDAMRYKDEAYSEGVTMGEWIRTRLKPYGTPFGEAIEAIANKATTCTNRVPRGAWCKRCERIH